MSILGSAGNEPHNVAFSYPPLLTDQPSFRLLRVERCDVQTSPLHFSLSTFSLSKAPQYIALSYAWRSPYHNNFTIDIFLSSGTKRELRDDVDWHEPCRFVICNGAKFRLLPNLHDALTQLVGEGEGRRLHEGAYLWIDAISINQHDISERGHQVPLMGKVFSNATEVIAWLGRSDIHAERAHRIHEAVVPLTEELQRKNKGRWGLFAANSFSRLDNLDPDILAQFDVNDDWHSLGIFLSRSWWWRTWIVQEMTLPRRLSIICGHLAFHWKHIDVLCRQLQISTKFWSPRKLTDAHYLQDLIEHVSRIFRARSIFRQPDPSGFFRLSTMTLTEGCNAREQVATAFMLRTMFDSRTSSATDPRDKVYSFIGLYSCSQLLGPGEDSDEMRGKGIQADYKQSVESCYINATKRVISTLPVLTLLFHASWAWHGKQEEGQGRRPANLPSWVPDFSCDYADCWSDFGIRHFCRNFRAGMLQDERIESWNRIFEESEDDDNGPRRVRLGLEAQYIDTVQFSDPLTFTSSEDQYRTFVTALPQPYCTRQKRAEALWRTLVVDQHNNSVPASRCVGCWFPSWLMSRGGGGGGGQRDAQQDDSSKFGKDFWAQEGLEFSEVGGKAEMDEDAQSFDAAILAGASSLGMLFVTDKGYIGQGMTSVEKGDQVWILRHARVLFVLRPTGRPEEYSILSPAYLHGFMAGERTRREEFREIWLA